MARPIVFDTSAFILASRQPDLRQRIAQLLRARRARVSAVTIAELYAGARSKEEAENLTCFFGFFARSGLILVPDLSDWELAGRMIERRGRLAGDVRPRDHLNDVLIAVCAARVGGTVLTANQRHLAVWTEMLRGSGFDVTATPILVSPGRG